MNAPNQALITNLEIKWNDFCNRIQATGDRWQAFRIIVSRYSEPHRYYHNLQHIADCLDELQLAKNYYSVNAPQLISVPQFNEIEAEIWLHDIDPDEEKSALQAIKIFLDLGKTETFTSRVADLIRNTKHFVDKDHDSLSHAEKLGIDIDLAILGQPKDKFVHYENNVRKEYSHVPEKVFRAHRVNVLLDFLSRPRIYLTEYFYDKYENQARENIKRSLINLIGQLSPDFQKIIDQS